MNAFILSKSTRIAADEHVLPIHHAAEILRRDMADVLRAGGEENWIRIELDPSLAAESWEASCTPEELLFRCGDDLGAAYALLSVSQRFLDIQPLDWWMSRKTKRKETVSVPCGAWQSPVYRVRFRGWFVNDEVLLIGWHQEEYAREEAWERIFETVLRCGGNMVIPGTDRDFDGEKLCRMALDRGLWLTQHHTELLGARMFARAYPGVEASYTLHPDLYEALWQEAIDRWAGERVVWAVGFRGQGDHAFWEEDRSADTPAKRGAYIEKVMRRQMEMVRAKDPGARFCTNLYGEIMALYREGHLKVPEEVIRLWGDNGFGRMVSRRQSNENPRTDAMPGENEPGQNGIYYHISFYDLQAANHITPLQIAPQRVAGELKTILRHHGDTMWNINVGSIYPHAFQLDMISRMWQSGEYDGNQAAAAFAERYYGTAEHAPLLTDYARAAVAYGPNEDDRAGDQYYHWPLRALAHALLRGGTEQPVESLLWAAKGPSFPDQARQLAATVKPGIASWGAYVSQTRRAMDALESTDPDAAERMRNREYLYGLIHRTGCEGLYSFCQACLHVLAGDDLQAFLWTDRALESCRRAAEAMGRVNGRFAHIYRNDCFAGVALTAQVLEGVRAWIRIRGDGERLYDWERTYLTPRSDAKLSLQSHRTLQLSDDELGLRLRGEIRLEESRE